MTDISRRGMLAGTAVLAATPALAQAAPAISLKGKSILVTGTSSGFGRLGALHYARLGAKVFATMRGLPRPEADELRAVAGTEKLDLTVLELDVTSDSQVAAAIGEAENRSGGALDVLVNNAGINIHGPVEVQDMDAMRLSFDTNVYGPHRTARAVLPAMRERRSGLVVNVSSQVGRVIFPMGGIYSATKFALESMSEQLAYELAPHGIEVAIIQPGGFPTNIGTNRARLTAALAARVEERRASAYPEQIAAMRAPPGAMQARPGMTRPDPMDVPRAIAEIIAMPAGTRPLRREVHPGDKPQVEINRVCRDVQLSMLGNSPYAPWARSVLD